MKAALLPATGDPDLFALGEVPDPPVGPTDVAVSVAAAAVNPVDLKTRSGFLPIELTFPAVLGWDVSGTVAAVGEQVDRFAVGDSVIGMIAQPVRRHGTYAERVVADQSLFAAAPATMSLIDSAALPLASLTARQTLNTLDLHDGSRVLVTGAAGAVGRISVQLLLRSGHTVGAVARADDGEDLHAVGVTTVTTAEGISAGEWDAVVDTAGVASAIGAVRDGGSFVSIDDNEQPGPQRGITPHKSYVNENGTMLGELVAAVDTDELDVPVARYYELAEVGRAHAEFGGGGIRGKVLVIP